MVQEDVSLTYEDFDVEHTLHLRPLIRRFAEESRLTEIYETRLNLAYFEKSLDSMLEQNMLDGVVAKVNGSIIGVFLYAITPIIYTGETAGHEIVWYIDPKHRKGKAGFRLWRKAMEQAKETGLDYFMMIHLETSMPERMKAFYEKQGCFHMESNYMKRL